MKTDVISALVYQNSANLKGGREIFLKITFWLLFWSGTWVLIIFSTLPGFVKLLLALSHILSHLFISLNVGHDANHNAITTHPFFAAVLKRSLDIVGVSSYCWRINHNKLHHQYTSIPDIDSTADSRTVVRLTRSAPRRFFHRFQHLYAPAVYSLVGLNYVFFRDLNDFRKYFFEKNSRPDVLLPFLECLVFKAFYFSYVLIIPMLILPYSPAVIVGTFLLSHILMGQLIILLQVPHFNLKTHEVTKADVATIGDAHLNFILKHSTDMAPESRFWGWLLGGTNNHIVHHLAPHVCHTHYPGLTEKLRAFCRAESRPYQYYETMAEGYLSHYLYLKNLGKPGA